jgi:hypothetical protein
MRIATIITMGRNMLYLLSFWTAVGEAGIDDRFHWRTRSAAGKGANRIDIFLPGYFRRLEGSGGRAEVEG